MFRQYIHLKYLHLKHLDMNKFKFIIKFMMTKQSSGAYNWNLLFPFAGVIIGCLTVSLTLSVMEGMEYAIFSKLENLSFSGKIMNINSSNKNELDNFLKDNNIQSQKGMEGRIIIMNNNEFRLVTIHGIDKIIEFKDSVLSPNSFDSDSSIENTNLYIGRDLALKLDLSIGDVVLLGHPQRINIFTGLPNIKKFNVGGIFDVDILDYNHRHIFCNYDLLIDFLPEKENILYLDKPLDKQFISKIKRIFPKLSYMNWEQNYGSFISAMKLEKFSYTLIGFLIIGISGFTLMSMMSLSVMQKVPQIGILRAIGMTAGDVSKIYIFQAILTSIISSSIGISLSLLIIHLNSYFNFMSMIFPGALFFNFPLILKNSYIILIFIISLILLVISGLYPSIKASRIDSIRAIGFRR